MRYHLNMVDFNTHTLQTSVPNLLAELVRDCQMQSIVIIALFCQTEFEYRICMMNRGEIKVFLRLLTSDATNHRLQFTISTQNSKIQPKVEINHRMLLTVIMAS